jgi:uncharacterized LabA/DUF88 family protein
MINNPGAAPQNTRYLFVDGNQLTATLNEVGQAWFGESIEIDFNSLKVDHQKAFYYDCLPARVPADQPGDHEQKVREKDAFFNSIRDLPGWHVRPGLAKHRHKVGQQQKEVDILIAVDMLSHAHRRNTSRITFITGDQDFAPLVEALVREGVYVQLVYPTGHVSSDLKHFADEAVPMTAGFLFARSTQQFRTRHSFPSVELRRAIAPAIESEKIARGFLEGREVAGMFRYNDGQAFSAVLYEKRNEQHLTVNSTDRRRGELVFEEQVGPVEWQTMP